MFGVTGRKIIS